MHERTTRRLFRSCVLLACIGGYVAFDAFRDGRDLADTGFIQAYALFAAATLAAVLVSLLPAQRAVDRARTATPRGRSHGRGHIRVEWRPQSTPALSPTARARQEFQRRGPVQGRLVVPMR